VVEKQCSPSLTRGVITERFVRKRCLGFLGIRFRGDLRLRNERITASDKKRLIIHDLFRFDWQNVDKKSEEIDFKFV